MPVYEHKLREELARLNPKERENVLAHITAKVSAGEMQFIPDPAAEVRANLQQPGFGELYGRRKPPPERTTVNVLPFSSATGVPIPINARSPEEARDIESGVQAASGAAAVTGGALAGAGAAPAMMSRIGTGAVTGLVFDQATERVLRRLGVPEPVADVAGDVVGVVTGGGAGGVGRQAGKKLLERGAGKGGVGLLAKHLLRIVAKGEAKTGARAAGAAATKLPGVSKVTLSSLSREQRNIISQLQGLARVSGNREAIKDAAKQMFGDEWQSVWKLIMAPHTRI